MGGEGGEARVPTFPDHICIYIYIYIYIYMYIYIYIYIMTTFLESSCPMLTAE